MVSLLEALVIVSEKAANVARLCRQENHLFQLLVQQKDSSEANPRFVKDFKTLADVLIQETLKHDIAMQFPVLQSHIRGEENNTFSNKLGDSICVEIKDVPSETAKLLERVLNGDTEAANLLAAEVHREIFLENINTSLPQCIGVELDIDNLGIWIDPIDSTAEYINAVESIDENDIHLTGLRCVTVLIGVFDRYTGIPLIGVINQPFFEYIGDRWSGKCYWGIDTPSCKLSSLSRSKIKTSIISLSNSENENVKRKLKSSGFTLTESAGAGYKILCTITGQTDGYILSKNSTFKWDTCGPQAILKSLGGDLICYDEVFRNKIIPINYLCKEEKTKEIGQFCNNGGIIAYTNEDILKMIISVITD